MAEEPEKLHLHFCLGLINYNAKADLVGAANDFEAFLKKTPTNQFPGARRKAEELLKLCTLKTADAVNEPITP